MQQTPFQITPGRVLRVWREYAEVTAADLARALPVSPGAVTNWETDYRGRKSAASLDTVIKIAAALEHLSVHFSKADGAAIIGMWQAAASVEVLPARAAWFHNFPAPLGPVWVWLRANPQSADRQVVLEFGPFDQEFSIPEDGGGMLVHSPTSLTNPPLKVVFHTPGWADFGAGTVPEAVAEALRLTLVAARDVIGRHAPHAQPFDEDEQRMFGSAISGMRALTTRLGGQWSMLAPHFGVLRPARRHVYALDETDLEANARPSDAVTDATGALVSQLMMTPEQVKAVRSARGLSRAAAAGRVNGFDRTHPLTERALESLETDGRIPTGNFALSRLDMAYGTDGRLGIDRSFDSRAVASWGGKSEHTVRFPEFWCGHVWFQPRGSGPGEVGEIELVWGPWRRRQRIRSGTVITTRKATPEGTTLNVSLPRGWHLTAGMGAVPWALDINEGWRPVSLRAALTLVHESVTAIRRSMTQR